MFGTQTHHEILLEVISASKAYSGVPALVDASLELRRGEVHALIGENGAGKSTLIRLLAGVLEPDKFEVMMEGRFVRVPDAQAAFDLGMRFLHQELTVVPELSVAENIFLGQEYPTHLGAFVRWSALNERAKNVLLQLGITHIEPRTSMARLGPGDQMLVRIAGAFAGEQLEFGERSNTKLYVMDEPTAALTGDERDMLFRVIRQLRERGCGILYVSHRLDEIFDITDRVTVMRNGRIVGTHNTSEITQNDMIREMTGRELEEVYPPRTSPYRDSVLLEVEALQTEHIYNVSFKLHHGEIIGIAGLGGSGRSEVIHALMGMNRVQAGDIRLEERSVRRATPVDRWHQGIAYVPEERRSQGLVMSRSVRDNITLPHLDRLSAGGMFLNRGRENQLSDELSNDVRLKATGTGQVVRELSGGNQQKVVFARALAREPRVLLLDQPTRGVDVGAKFDIYALIRRISTEGTGIVMVSADMPELLGICDRILVMRYNRPVGIVRAREVDEEMLLSLAYGEIPAGVDLG